MSEPEKYWAKVAVILTGVGMVASVFSTCVIMLIKGTQYLDASETRSNAIEATASANFASVEKETAENFAAVQKEMAAHSVTLDKIGWSQWHSPIYLHISQFDEWIDDEQALNSTMRWVHTKDLTRDTTPNPNYPGPQPAGDQ
jgi:hypothetical protein